jgi:TRAP transporter TAXI family solute receptor
MDSHEKGEEKQMKLLQTACAMITAAMVVGAAQAQTVGVGTTKGGATAQISAAISKIVTLGSDVKMRPQPMGGTQQYFPIVDAGDLEFGVSNMPQYNMGKHGFGLSKRKHPNLRVVANMMKFQVGILVPKRSGINKPEDMKGHRYPVRFKSSPLIGLILQGFLANAGLSEKDIQPVPVVALRQHWNLMKQGKTEVATAAIGSAIVKDMNANIPGGVKFVSMRDDPAAVARVQKIYPKGWIEAIPPSPKLVGFDKPLNAISYDYLLWTHKGASDEIVYKVAKAMYDNEQGLKDTSPLWRSHKSATMAKDHGTGPEGMYHPGAAKFYKEVGIWKR